MAYTVPAAQADSIKKFLALPPTADEAFLKALSEAGPQFNITDLGVDAIHRLAEFPTEVVWGIVQVLGSMYLTKDSQDTPLETFVSQDVKAALRNAEVFSKESADTEWDRLRKFILGALKLEQSVGTAAKAGYVLTQHERVFVSARILTDIRPIFHESVSEKPDSALIIHMLRITQRDNHRQVADLVFALDSNDVRRLKVLVDRALKKEETLKAQMKDCGVTVLNPKATF